VSVITVILVVLYHFKFQSFMVASIGVGAQSTLGARHFCPKIYAWKINKIPEFYIFFVRKIFSRFFWREGGKCPSPPVSYAYGCINKYLILSLITARQASLNLWNTGAVHILLYL